MCSEAIANIANRSVSWYNNSSGKQFDIMYQRSGLAHGSYYCWVLFLDFLRLRGSGDGNVLYLDWGSGYMTVNICQNNQMIP